MDEKPGGNGTDSADVKGATLPSETINVANGVSTDLINASGHIQEVDRNFSLLTLTGVGINQGSTWGPAGSSIIIALFNGGPPGVLYEFIVVSVCYWVVAACIAELASAIPSSGGVYHWASVTPGKKWGRVVGFYAGYWNWLGWTLGGVSVASIAGNIFVQMYAAHHPDLVVQPWHIFLASVIIAWMACFLVCFGNRLMPHLNGIGIFFTIVVVAAMPGSGGRPAHASSSFVWSEWQDTGLGYPQGYVFIAGMLNGAFSVGTPDAVSHLAEEIPLPGVNLPKAIAFQMVIGFVTGFFYLVAVLYAINDFEALAASPFPIAEIYFQATQSPAGETGLLALLLFAILLTLICVFIASGRVLWTLGRDNATPFPKFLTTINKRFGMPLNATMACGVLTTVLLCIYVGNTIAFNALVGSYVLLSSSSYIAAILPNLLTERKNIIYGPFHMKGALGFIMEFIACAYMTVWFVIYCFPPALPVTAATMNWSSLIWGGLTILVTLWWFVSARKGYKGPQAIGGMESVAEKVRRVSVSNGVGGA
ncbi:hypothetical protein LTR59_014807 [Friedmanniomyces endolithicus]|nr:hypothetical protein LTR94_018443 [Friedmanniomyces endolithicus]KAK0774688.1 hypothetical protein LTR59_014807 [Friedmanniomyces endolithicus]KAK0774900.1 hypothetical protein LTR38_016057 [Friedmanniomyces endolithicus]